MPRLRNIRRPARLWRPALVLVAVCALALSCRTSEVEITLLTMNDFHGALVHGGHDPDSGRPWGGAVAFATRLHHERQRRPRRTFLFDAGDQMQGTPESNLLFGRSSIEVLNRLGVDAAALGNHEFDWGVDTLRARLRDMRYPMLAANVFEKSSGKRPAWLQPTCIVERDGVRIGVIGVITPETPRVTMPQNVAMLHFAPADSGVTALAEKLRAGGADLVVVVCHVGGRQGVDGRIEGPVAALARGVRGVDAIVAGHHHTVLAGHVDEVPIVIAASRGRALGRVTLLWDGERVRHSEVDVQRVFADSLDPRPVEHVVAYVDSVRRVVAPAVAQVLAEAPRTLDEETLAHLVADAMRDAVDADVAFTNIGGIRARVPSGPITWGRLFEVVPFENTLVVAKLSGRQLRVVLESRLVEARVSGLRGRIRREATGAARLVDVHTAAGALRDGEVYRVVTNNFIAYGGDGFVGFLDGDDLEWTEIGVRDALRRWLQRATAGAADWDGDARRRRLVDADVEPGSDE